MKDGSSQGSFYDDDEGSRAEGDPLGSVIFDFEDTGDALSLLPLAARRALDVAGFRLSLEGWQSLGLDDRKDLSVEGGRDAVDASAVEQAVRGSRIPATRIRPVPDPDALLPPEQLSTFLGPRRAIDPAEWAKLRALDRYALVHVLRRSIAHDDPIRLEAAIGTILPRGASVRPSPADRRSSGRPNGKASPSPNSPARLAKPREGASTSSTPRPPSTERRPSPLTSRSEREAPRGTSTTPPARSPRLGNGPAPRGEPARVLVRGSARIEREVGRSDAPRADYRSEPPASDPLPSTPYSTRGQRDTLDSVDNQGRARRSDEPGPFGQPRAIRHFDEMEGDRYELEGDISAPPEQSMHPGYSTHLSSDGEARMVDVGEKAITARRAVAQGVVEMRRETARSVQGSDVPKGDVIATARIAGIMAAKRTPELIPLCHQIALTKVEVHIDIDANGGILTVEAVVEAQDRTGVEMEALTAVSAACLTIYDMLKGIDRDMSISDIRLLEKSGGRTGSYARGED